MSTIQESPRTRASGHTMSNDHRTSPEEARLFREAVKDVVPLPDDRVAPWRPRPLPVPRQTSLNEAQVIHELLSDAVDLHDLETGEELVYVHPGVQRGVLRKLRRGLFSVDGELDLHGMTVPVARQALVEFLRQCQRHHARCVRIIHGKGNGSLGKQPVLKAKVGHWLRQRNDVLAYSSARPVDGGTGAIYVLLRAR